MPRGEPRARQSLAARPTVIKTQRAFAAALGHVGDPALPYSCRKSVPVRCFTGPSTITTSISNTTSPTTDRGAVDQEQSAIGRSRDASRPARNPDVDSGGKL